ncbi:hypothetical protein ACFWQK_13795 [Brachybacterium paraconglomeratum]
MFAKIKGEPPWYANEIELVADYFGVTVGDLFDGLGLFRDTKKPHRLAGGASPSGAPSRTRTPGPLTKSLDARVPGTLIQHDFSEVRAEQAVVG